MIKLTKFPIGYNLIQTTHHCRLGCKDWIWRVLLVRPPYSLLILSFTLEPYQRIHYLLGSPHVSKDTYKIDAWL